MRHPILACLIACFCSVRAEAGGIASSDERIWVEERSIAQLQSDLTAGRITSEHLVRAYLKRIESLDRAGPRLRSVIAVNPEALAQARASDRERRQSGARGPLHGIPVLLKDNIETADRMPT